MGKHIPAEGYGMKRSGFQPRIKPLSGVLRTASLKPLRKSKCKGCRTEFTPTKPMQIVCSPKCGQTYADMLRTKRERKEDRARREALKTRSDWIKEAQSAFNAYIRERDKDRLCICCDKPLDSGDIGGGYDCGHYRSVGSAPHLRFDERNAHAQRKQCNRYGAGRAVDYRIGLIRRLGLAAVEALEADQESRNWTIDDLRALKATYKAKLKALKEAA